MGLFDRIFSENTKESSGDADSKKGSYPRCGGPSIGRCEAGNCRCGTIPGYPANEIYGYENCSAMWTCSAYDRYRDSLRD